MAFLVVPTLRDRVMALLLRARHQAAPYNDQQRRLHRRASNLEGRCEVEHPREQFLRESQVFLGKSKDHNTDDNGCVTARLFCALENVPGNTKPQIR